MQLFDRWKEQNLEFMKSIDQGTNPRHFIREISETLLDTYRNINLIDKYAIYQILMDYWDEDMKDDVYMLIEEGWVAKTYKILEKNKKGEDVDKGWTCDLLPKEIVINEYFVEEKKKIEKLQAQLEEIQQKIEEMKEEYGGDEDVLNNVDKKEEAKDALKNFKLIAFKELFPIEYRELSQTQKQIIDLMGKIEEIEKNNLFKVFRNEKRKLTKQLINSKIKELSEKDDDYKIIKNWLEIDSEIKCKKKELKEILDTLEEELNNKLLKKENLDVLKDVSIIHEYIKLLEEKSDLNKLINENENELDKKLLKKYSELSKEDVKRLVVEKKWLARLEEGIRDELDNIILEITNIVKELAERYDEPLPEIEKEVTEYEKKVKEHLKIMGFDL